MDKEQKTFVLSDGTKINSKGYKIDINGLDISRFETNPIMLYEHNTERVIGRWIDLLKSATQLTATPEFDTEDDEAMRIAGKVERGFLNGASIGIIVHEIQFINGVDVVTKSELYEASIVSVPSDSGAVRLYNEKLECLTIDKLKLSIRKHKSTENDFKDFYRQICEALGLDNETDIESVLDVIKKLTKAKGETEIEEAFNLDVLTVSEAKHYTKMYRSGQTDILKIIAEKRSVFEDTQNKALIDLYNKNSDKIITHLTIDGWNEVKKLGYESAKKIVDSFPERIFLSKMIKGGNEVQDLDWYRKHNPKALWDNPELYQTLLNNYKKNQ